MAIKVLVQYRPGYPQTSSTVQAPMWMDITERVDFASLQWEQQATDKNTSLRFDVFTFLPISTTRYDEYPSGPLPAHRWTTMIQTRDLPMRSTMQHSLLN